MSESRIDGGQGAQSSAEGSEETFDARLRRLEEIVRGLEGGELELEPAIERYREGVELLKGCREVLAGYKRQVEELTQETEAALKPYPGDPDLEGA